jgi:hypothetical protein
VRALTKADKIRGVKLRDLGCCVCLNENELYTPAAIHHIDGQTKDGCHDLTIPLCAFHHQIKSNDGKWVSRHGDGRAAFEEAYGTEQELLEQVNNAIGY